MQDIIDQPLAMPEETGALVACAERASQWAGEPFLHPDEDVVQVLAPGTARRRALDDALAEIEAGRKEPSNDWKIRYALMLGLERVLSEKPPQLALRHRAAPPPGRRARRDADRADRRRQRRPRTAARKVDDECERRGGGRATARTASTPRRTLEVEPRSSRRRPTRAPSGATASAIRPRPARRSPPPASSRPRARSAS